MTDERTEVDHKYTDEIVCPWCGQQYRDSWEYSDDGGQHECSGCGRPFTFRRDTSVYYTTKRVTP